jgi:hypothetical protein
LLTASGDSERQARLLASKSSSRVYAVVMVPGQLPVQHGGLAALETLECTQRLDPQSSQKHRCVVDSMMSTCGTIGNEMTDDKKHPTADGDAANSHARRCNEQ